MADIFKMPHVPDRPTTERFVDDDDDDSMSEREARDAAVELKADGDRDDGLDEPL